MSFDVELNTAIGVLANEAQDHVAGLRRLLDRRVEMLMDNFNSGKEKNILYPFDLDGAAHIAKIQAELAVWSNVEAYAKARVEKGQINCWLTSIIEQREMARQSLTGNYHNPLSRSTSLISNISEDLKAQAFREFLYATDRMNVERLWELAGPETQRYNSMLKMEAK